MEIERSAFWGYGQFTSTTQQGEEAWKSCFCSLLVHVYILRCKRRISRPSPSWMTAVFSYKLTRKKNHWTRARPNPDITHFYGLWKLLQHDLPAESDVIILNDVWTKQALNWTEHGTSILLIVSAYSSHRITVTKISNVFDDVLTKNHRFWSTPKKCTVPTT